MALQSTITLPLIHSIFNVRQQHKGARMRLSIAITALFVTILIAAPVQAENWSINGSSCVPGDPAIQNNRYLVTAGTVKHQSTATGLITLYCPITFPRLIGREFASPLRFRALVVTYADSDGPGTVANITAQLVRLKMGTGSLTNIGNALDSNIASSEPTSGSKMIVLISHIADSNDYYYVRVDLNRSDTSASSTLFGVNLN
jgi:hypothetical protein